MKVNYAHLCDYATLSVDRKISMMGVFSHIFVGKLPAVHPSSYLVFEIELDYTEVGQTFPGKVQCVDMDGTTVVEFKAVIKTEGKATPGQTPRLPQILRLPGLKLSREGVYDINIFLGNDPGVKNRTTFEVVQMKPPQPPPIQGNPPLQPPAPTS